MKILLLVFFSLASWDSVLACPANLDCTNLTPRVLVSKSYPMTVRALDGIKTISLGGEFYVENIFILAQSANSRDSQGEIIVNGVRKGTPYTPGEDPPYTVTVRDNTSTIDFRTTTNSVKYLQVIAYLRPVNSHRHRHSRRSSHLNSRIAYFSHEILELVDELIPYTTVEELGDYLMPIRLAAVEALAVGEARGDLSTSGKPVYYALYHRLNDAEPFFRKFTERTAIYPTILNMKIEKEKLYRALW